MMLDLARSRGRDQFGQRFAPDPGKGKVDNIGIAEEVVKEWFNGFQRVGPAQLKENYPHTARCLRHSPETPERANLLPSVARVNGAMQKFGGIDFAR
jgi:hypothetical protein